MPFAVAANQSTGFGVALDAMPPSGDSAYAALILATPGLQNYYKCNDYSGTTLADSKGTETLVISGTNSLTTTGPIAGSLSTAFDTNGGTNGTATNSSHTQICGSSDFTTEGWAKTSSTGTNVFFFGEGSGSSNNPVAYIGLAAGKPRMFVRNSAGVGDIVGSSPLFNDGQWHYFAMVGNRSANTLTLYVDNLGSQANGSYPTGTYGLNRFSLSSLYRTSNALFAPISCAHVATYNTALTLAQIQSHYTAGTAARLAFLSF